MLNFIFNLNFTNSVLFIAFCLIILLTIGIAIKAKSKLLAVFLTLFALVTAIKAFNIIVQSLNLIPNYPFALMATVVAIIDILIAISLFIPKTHLNKAVWISFLIIHLLLVLAYNCNIVLALFNQSINIAIIIKIIYYLHYALPAIVIIAFVALLILKCRPKVSTDLDETNQTANTDDLQSSQEVTSDTTSQLEQPADTITQAPLLDEQTDGKTAATQTQAEQAPTISPNVVVLPTMFCKSCGYKAQTDSTVCPHCYNALTKLTECPNCHAMTAGNYCGRCGTKVK